MNGDGASACLLLGSVTDYKVEIGGMLAGGIIAAWLGAGYLSRIPKSKIMGVIAVLLIGTAGLVAVETIISGTAWTMLPLKSAWRAPAAVVAGGALGHHQQPFRRCRR